jgi:hypothetical protein
MPEEGINQVEFPVFLWDLWQWFLRLNASRDQGMGGPSRISEQSIGWFFHNRGMKPEQWQLDAIQLLDSVALEQPRKGKK